MELCSLLISTLILSGQSPRPSFDLNYLLQAQSPNTVSLGGRASTQELGGEGVQLIPQHDKKLASLPLTIFKVVILNIHCLFQDPGTQGPLAH